MEAGYLSWHQNVLSGYWGRQVSDNHLDVNLKTMEPIHQTEGAQLCDSGTTVIEVTNHSVIELQALSTRMNAFTVL